MSELCIFTKGSSAPPSPEHHSTQGAACFRSWSDPQSNTSETQPFEHTSKPAYTLDIILITDHDDDDDDNDDEVRFNNGLTGDFYVIYHLSGYPGCLLARCALDVGGSQYKQYLSVEVFDVVRCCCSHEDVCLCRITHV